jgi:hypothetical protein
MKDVNGNVYWATNTANKGPAPYKLVMQVRVPNLFFPTKCYWGARYRVAGSSTFPDNILQSMCLEQCRLGLSCQMQRHEM